MHADVADVAGVRRDAVVVVGVVAALALPHLLLGPSITADDWVWVRNGEFLGWWDAGGSRQVGRPGAFALYALVFGVGGAHPLVHYLVQVALWAAAAICVLLAMREFFDRRLALTLTVVWLLVPSHTTLELWASTSQAWVAIGLLALGVRQVDRAVSRRGALWPGLLALGAAGAFYEVAILAGPVLAALVERRATRSWGWRTTAMATAAAIPALGWALGSATVYSSEVATTEHLWLEHLAGPLAMGLPVEVRLPAVLTLALTALSVIAAARARRERDASPDAYSLELVIAGGLLVVVGVLPALRSYTIPSGMGNRLTAVSGIGATMLWVGAVRSLHVELRRLVRIGVVTLAAVLVIWLRVDDLSQWDAVGETGTAAATELGLRAQESVDRSVIHDGRIAVRRDFYGLYDGWNATAAAQVIYGDPSLVVQVDIRCLRSGPTSDDPLEQYGRRAEHRVPGCRR